jgi:hypothetical protein
MKSSHDSRDRKLKSSSFSSLVLDFPRKNEDEDEDEEEGKDK